MSDQTDLEKNIPPELFSLLGKFIQSSPSNITDSASAAEVSNSSVNTEQKPAGGDILSSLLSNPEIISKLPQVLSMLKPLMEGGSSMATSASAPNSALVDTHQSNATTPANLIKPQKKECDNRAALLYALKPYLKRERQEAIDYMVKLSRLGDILKSL